MKTPLQRILLMAEDHEKRIVWGSIVLALVLYLVLIVAVLPARTFFNSDPGVKFIQVDNLVTHRWQSLRIDYLGEEFDPSRRFSPFNTSFFYTNLEDGHIFGVYSVPFVFLSSLLYQLLGFYGLYVLPGLSTVGVLLVTYHLGRRFAPRFAWLIPLLVAFLSPFLFYSLDFWEHSPAVLLSTLGIWCLSEGLARDEGRWIFVAGLALGLGTWFRAEIYIMAFTCGLALIWIRSVGTGLAPAPWKHWLSLLLAYGAGLALIMFPIWLFQWYQFGSLVGPHVQNAVVPQVSGEVARQANMHPLALLARKGLRATKILVPWTTNTIWTLLVLGLVLLRVSIRLVRRWPRLLLLALAGIMSTGVLVAVFRGVQGHWVARNVVQSFPVVLFLFFWNADWPLRDERIRQQSHTSKGLPLQALVLISVVFTAIVCLTTPSSGGPQWGARFLFPAYPLLVVFIVYTLENTVSVFSWRTPVNVALVATFVLLCLCSGLTQYEGVRQLAWSKSDYERLTRAIERLSPEVVVTDIWWLPAMTASASECKTWFLVEHGRNGSLPELLSVLRQHDVAEFAYATTPEGLIASSASLSAAHLTERARHTERIWLDVEFITYALPAD